MNINEILAMDTLFQNKEYLSFEPIKGGVSNETNLVTDHDIKYIIKINFNQNEYLNLTRKSELKRINSLFDLIDGYVKGIEKFQVKVSEGYKDILV